MRCVYAQTLRKEIVAGVLGDIVTSCILIAHLKSRAKWSETFHSYLHAVYNIHSIRVNRPTEKNGSLRPIGY